MTHLHDSHPSALWTSATYAVAALVANGIWQSWFSRADGTTAFVLMIVALLGWPLTLASIAFALSRVIERCEDHPVLGLLLLAGVVGATLAVHGMPRLWSWLVCAAVAVTMGLKIQRLAQDDADLERL